MSENASPEDSLALSDRTAQVQSAFEALERNAAARKRVLTDGLEQVRTYIPVVLRSSISRLQYISICHYYIHVAHTSVKFIVIISAFFRMDNHRITPGNIHICMYSTSACSCINVHVLVCECVAFLCRELTCLVFTVDNTRHTFK